MPLFFFIDLGSVALPLNGKIAQCRMFILLTLPSADKLNLVDDFGSTVHLRALAVLTLEVPLGLTESEIRIVTP